MRPRYTEPNPGSDQKSRGGKENTIARYIFKPRRARRLSRRIQQCVVTAAKFLLKIKREWDATNCRNTR